MHSFILRSCLLFLSLLFFSCTPHEEQAADFILLPSPREAVWEGGNSSLDPAKILGAFSPEGQDTLPILFGPCKAIDLTEHKAQAQVFFRINKEMEIADQGYQLNILKDKIQIEAKDPAGLMYAFVSLAQLMEDAIDQQVLLPRVEIRDYPGLAFRPIHLDIKHHRETESYYYDLIDELALQKVNGIIVEFEDKLAYQRRKEVGAVDAFSIEQWKALSVYAKARHIEINPLVQGLGHASFILKHEINKNLRDDLSSDWAFNPLDPGTYELQFDLYLDAIEATPHGRYLHVGGDEVHTTGRGSGTSQLELNLIWLNKVCDFAEAQGRIPIFWDDMPLKHAGVYSPMFKPEMGAKEVEEIWEKNEPNLMQFIDQFPKNCVYMRWNYQTPGTYGNLKAMDWFSENGFSVMGATAGQTRWVLMPQNESNIDNIRSFALSSQERNFDGLLLTLWDDDSPHFELYQRGISAFAEYAWAGDQRSKAAFKAAYRHRAFGPGLSSDSHAFIDKMEGPVAFWKNILLREGAWRNGLIGLEQALDSGIIELPDPSQPGVWAELHQTRLSKVKTAVRRCDSLSEQLTGMKQEALRNGYRLEVYEQVNELLKFSFHSLLLLEAYDLASSEEQQSQARQELQGLSTQFVSMRSQFEEVYAKTRVLNKPAGFILDQDHHAHSANQTINFDWQFISERLFLEKLLREFGEQQIQKNQKL